MTSRAPPDGASDPAPAPTKAVAGRRPVPLEDYEMANDLMRASRNAVQNMLETTNVPLDQLTLCLDLTNATYNMHVATGAHVVRQLQAAVARKDRPRSGQWLRALNQHNRRTVQLTQLLKYDVRDNGVDVDAPQPAVDPDRPVPITKFLGYLQTMKAKMEAARAQCRVHRLPYA